ncbi:MAG: adenosylcobinamide-phosphate synthase [Pseudohongiellaceae bacterium]|jgi:adenosylcobinamide-phosphate synthase
MACALVIDYLFGEPKRFHPLVGFGTLANWIESLLNSKKAAQSSDISRLRGALGWLLLCIPLPLILTSVVAKLPPSWAFLFSVFSLYLCIAPNSLAKHAYAIQDSLAKNNIEKARLALNAIVSRDCGDLDIKQIATGSVESVLENGSDAVIAPLFWYFLLGAPGVLLYRLANTLDAMWGYRTERFNNFGFAAAKLDDFLNWVPSRCCAFLYAVGGNFFKAIRCWQSQARLWSSPNAGPVMASGAGALNLIIGGSASYHGQEESRPVLGIGEIPNAGDIRRSVNLVNKATGYFVLVILIWELGFCYLVMAAI